MNVYKKNNNPILPFNHETLNLFGGYKKSKNAGTIKSNQQSLINIL